MDLYPTLLNSEDNITVVNNSWFSIGRSLSCDYTINSLEVSRLHCIIKKSGTKWMLFDMSSNGTMVNTQQVNSNSSAELKDGDVIKLGSHKDLLLVFKNQCDIECETPSKRQSSVEALKEQVARLESECTYNSTEQIDAENKIEEIPEEKPVTKTKDQNMDMLENEFTCSICSELFINAVTLKCCHTFCKFCLNQWQKEKRNCPICRQPIVNVSPTIVLDNYIEKFLSNQSEEVRKARRDTINQREVEDDNLTPTTPSPPCSSYDSSSEYDDEDDDEDEEDEDDDDDEDEETDFVVNSVPLLYLMLLL